jgi:hypothetical protein
MAFMADVKTPGLGGVNKPTIVIAGIAGVVAVGYAWYKHKKNAAVTTATTASAYGYGAASAYGYGVTATNYGYGAELEAEEQAIAQEGDGYAYGGYGYGASGSGVGTSIPPVNTTAPAATNAEWAQYAQQFLVNQGYNATTVAGALGAYITGSNVGDNESVVQAAIAFEGYPPVAGTDNYPPSINTSAPSGQSGSGTTVKVPDVTKMTAGAAHNAIQAAGLHALANPAQKATWIVTGTNPAAGTSVASGSSVVIAASAPTTAKK